MRACRLLLSGILCLGLAHCGTTAAKAPAATPGAALTAAPLEPGFASPETAQPSLVGSLVTAAPAKIVADLDALSRRLDLPMMFGQQLKSVVSGFGWLGDQARFSAIWDRLDPGAQVAVVWVLPPNAGAKGYCAALTFRDGVSAQRTFEGMGTAGEQRHGVASRRTPEGDILWGRVNGRTLFISGSPEAMLLAAGLAEAAQAAPAAGQVVATVLPPALIAASGKSRDALVAEMVAGAGSSITNAPGFATPTSQRFATALVAAGAKLALDASAFRFVLDVGPNDGLLVQTEVVPAPGTGFAAAIARRTPYAFDRKLPVRDDSTAVTALGRVAGWLSYLTPLFAATGSAGQAFQRELSKLGDVTNEGACVVDATEAGITSLCSAALRDGVSAKAALDAVASSMETEVAWEGELYGRKLSPLKIKRSRDLLEIEKKFEQPDKQAQAISKALAGGEVMRSAFTVQDGRLVMATGPDTRAVLNRYGTGGDLQAAPLVAAALARTKGAEAMMSLDVVAMVLRTLSLGKGLPGEEIATAARVMPGLSEMTAPFVFALRGGDSLTGELRLPLGSLENIARVVRGMFGPAGSPR
jgi:hypothetical protein